MDKMSQRVKELLADCHESGLGACLIISNGDTGRTIRAMEGSGFDIVAMIAALTVEFSHKSNLKLKEVFDAVEDIAKEYKKNEKKK